jgi:hypothetical protein
MFGVSRFMDFLACYHLSMCQTVDRTRLAPMEVRTRGRLYHGLLLHHTTQEQPHR